MIDPALGIFREFQVPFSKSKSKIFVTDNHNIGLTISMQCCHEYSMMPLKA